MEPGYQKKPEFEQDFRRNNEPRTRKCLVCKVDFLNECAGEHCIGLRCRDCAQWGNL